MNLLRVALAFLGVGFAALIVWAMVKGNFSGAGQWLTSDPWGIVTLADLYFGFLMFSVIIFLFERSFKAVLWIAPIPFLGNVWVVVWFVLRLPRIARALRG
ncbi:hypothetical protein [Ahrensia marina]|jgi:hypothetical protein|uniref:DUF1475 domain-containing protein n=1 Tax=Ahrensia marina TaxID=1514904 RepID=A0A0N0VLY2_9HYPH|nr:hypothetical protein [Ahrensia marina]KPB01738.1 hypothetical protein SU32_06550 [Ahrensia marina]